MIKILQTARIQRFNWQQELNTFLRNYRAAPHATTGRSPAELMFSRKEYEVRLPQMPKLYSDKELREKDRFAKFKMKYYAERKNVSKPFDTAQSIIFNNEAERNQKEEFHFNHILK